MNKWREMAHIDAYYVKIDVDASEVCDDNDTSHFTTVIGDEQVKIFLYAPYCGASTSNTLDSLVSWVADGMGYSDLLEANKDVLFAILNKLRTPGVQYIGVYTVWHCEAGWSYIPGEPDEYDADAQLIGYIDPKTLAFVEVDV